MRPILIALALLLSLPNLQSATAQPVDDVFLRSFYWFRFVGGKDVREYCQTGQGDYYRLVYNAIAREQIRTYDVKYPRGGAAELTIRVIGPAAVNVINISEFTDILGPWRGYKLVRTMAAADVARLAEQLGQSGAFGPLQVGFEAPSNDFYWAVASCRGGQFYFHVFHYPSDGFRSVQFEKTLFALDQSGIPFNAPRDLPPSRFRGDPNYVWRLKVGQDGPAY